MIPSSPLLAPLIPFLCPPLPPLPLLSHVGFTPHCSLTQYSAFVSSIMVVGVDLNLCLVPSSCLLKVPVHTGVSVQRRDRCTDMQ